MYEEGNAVPKDINRAAELYISSARGGLQEARERLASLGEDRPGKRVSSSVKTASAKPAPGRQEQTAPTASQSTALTSAYVVQLGSFKTAEEAEAHWSRIKNDPALASLPHQLEQADLGEKGVWHRLLVAGGSDRKPATALCDQLMAAGRQCLVRRATAQTATAASGQ
jgi:cell division septation protein DedD